MLTGLSYAETVPFTSEVDSDPKTIFHIGCIPMCADLEISRMTVKEKAANGDEYMALLVGLFTFGVRRIEKWGEYDNLPLQYADADPKRTGQWRQLDPAWVCGLFTKEVIENVAVAVRSYNRLSPSEKKTWSLQQQQASSVTGSGSSDVTATGTGQENGASNAASA